MASSSSPIIAFLCLLNEDPLSGLVRKSLTIFCIGWYTTTTSPDLILSVTLKYRMFICQGLFVLDLFPFPSNLILLVLSCCNTDGCDPNFLMIDFIGRLTACCSMYSFTHITKFIASSTPTISATVELVVFTFCLFDRENTAPLPNVNIAPVWLHMSLCTAKEASML